ncbi:MAG: aminoacyl-tRNA hydrolase [Sphingobacteriaceae bacterium]|nr:aminoacyl-tRNA hydrolase [Sphingobacteriaceae bacterium]
MLTELQIKGIKKELQYFTSRSGGKGGQNVNKVESKVELEFNIQNSEYLTEHEKIVLLAAIHKNIKSGNIKVSCEKYRSQLENKIEALNKLIRLINFILKPVKIRKSSKPTKSSKRKRTESKKKISEKKINRRKISNKGGMD